MMRALVPAVSFSILAQRIAETAALMPTHDQVRQCDEDDSRDGIPPANASVRALAFERRGKALAVVTRYARICEEAEAIVGRMMDLRQTFHELEQLRDGLEREQIAVAMIAAVVEPSTKAPTGRQIAADAIGKAEVAAGLTE